MKTISVQQSIDDNKPIDSNQPATKPFSQDNCTNLISRQRTNSDCSTEPSLSSKSSPEREPSTPLDLNSKDFKPFTQQIIDHCCDSTLQPLPVCFVNKFLSLIDLKYDFWFNQYIFHFSDDLKSINLAKFSEHIVISTLFNYPRYSEICAVSHILNLINNTYLTNTVVKTIASIIRYMTQY